MDRKRVHVVVEGTVQGVFFRTYAHEAGKKLGLSGWVRNRPDGTVEVVMEGDEANVKKMIQWLHKGSPSAVVERVAVSEEKPLGDNQEFNIRYN